jgi:hypothetical protein
LPYPVFRSALRRINATESKPVIFYLHPWEVDPEQPRPQSRVPLKSRFRHYLNLKRTVPRLRRLLNDFTWNRIDRTLAATPQTSA